MEWCKWWRFVDCIEDCCQLSNLFGLIGARYFKCHVSEVFRAKPHTTSSSSIIIAILQAGSGCMNCGFFCMFCNQWMFSVSWVCTFCIMLCEDMKVVSQVIIECYGGVE